MIEGLDHIGIAVASLDEARKFYEGLGLTVAHVEELAAEGVRVAVIPCGSTRIELLEPLSPDSVVGRFLARRGPGVHHLCFATGDVDGDSEQLRAKGLEVLREQPTEGAEGCRVQFVHPKSTGGVLVELSERPTQNCT
ncbi:MAG TPA: methylmalonyl-CoA epimerase [Thermoanaerobaculia bacterium]|nr:methylmalonyl-CoA epimerase [Thermoanaerobaculia bacterium]